VDTKVLVRSTQVRPLIKLIWQPSGIVCKFGQGADKGAVKLGDRVGIKWTAAACGTCRRCRNGFDGHCSTVKISGYFTPGTFAEYAIAPANYVTPIPAGLDSAEAAPMLCAGLTTYSALRKCGAKSGDWVVVSGAGGGLGHLAIQLGARGMAFRMIGIDHGSKEAIVKECGAEAFVDMTKFDDKSIAEEVLRITDGEGAAAVIVCAGSNKAYGQALPMLGFGGTVVCVGIPDGELAPISNAYPGTLLPNQSHIVGSSIGSQREAIEVLKFAARGVVKTHYRLEKLDKLGEVFQKMADGKMEGRV
jgi:propanol-preferring alcohol dehydrogenase